MKRTSDPRVKWIPSAGYPQDFHFMYWKVHSNNINKRQEDTQKKEALSIILNIHNIPPRIKKVAEKPSVRTTFTALNKPGNSCTKVIAPGPSKGQCTRKHAKRFMYWRDGVLYEVPFSSQVNVGQTRQFLKQCLKERSHSLKVGTGSNMAVHCKACNCFPRLKATKASKQHRGTHACEIYDVWAIEKCDKHCVSHRVSYWHILTQHKQKILHSWINLHLW